jgi:hypothetical protein
MIVNIALVAFIIISAYALLLWWFFAWVWRNFKDAARGGTDGDIAFIVEIGGVICVATWWLGTFAVAAIAETHPILGGVFGIMVFFAGLAFLAGMIVISAIAAAYADTRNDKAYRPDSHGMDEGSVTPNAGPTARATICAPRDNIGPTPA